MSAEKNDETGRPAGKSPNTLQVIGSVLSAAMGIQNSKNRERDFKQGKLGVYIVTGLVATALFIGTVYTVVHVVLKNAGH